VRFLTCTRAVWIAAAVLASDTCPHLYAEAETLNLCTVVGRAADYSRKAVRLRGILAVGREAVVLYDPECAKGTADVAVTPKFKRSRRLDRQLQKTRRAWVVVEGTFYGPELAEVDPKLPQWMKDKLKGTMTRYGHLGAYSTQIEITKIITVEAVPAATPWM
jgi:hypothetical protein